jgi:hypothetical protein
MPTRYLKPGVRDSEAIDNLSPQAENIFYRLLVTVDDFGRFDARPAMIKAQCFPIKESVSINKCKELLEELSRANLILLYEAEGKPYLQMCKWDNIPRAKESKYPAHEGTCIQLYTDVPLTETETETKTKTKTDISISPPSGESEDKTGLPKCFHEEVIDLYHIHLPTLRKVEIWNETRKGYLRQRWREVALELSATKPITAQDVLNWWAEFFTHIGTSKFLTGRVNSKDGRAFVADLEWILKPSNFAKIVEGKYHGTN